MQEIFKWHLNWALFNHIDVIIVQWKFWVFLLENGRIFKLTINKE